MVQVPTKRLRAKVFAADGSSFVINQDEINTQIQMSLVVSMTLTSQRNSGLLRIINLSQQSRDQLSASTDAVREFTVPSGTLALLQGGAYELNLQQGITNTLGKAYVVIEAGEDQVVGKVFEGSCEFPVSTWDSGDWATDVPVADGQAGSTGSSIVTNAGRNTTLFQIVSFVIGRMGLEPGNLTEAQLNASVGGNTNTRFRKGLSITATGDSFLNEIFRLTGAEWWVDRGKFYVVRKGLPVAGRVTELSDQTAGMRANPQQFDKSSLKVSMDYNSAMRVGSEINVRFLTVVGRYRCDAVAHMIDNSAGDWATEAILRQIPRGN